MLSLSIKPPGAPHAPVGRHSHASGARRQRLGAAGRAPRRAPHGVPPPRASGNESGGGETESESFGDDLLDFMMAGRKLRRWYGAEGKVLPKDGRQPQEGGQEQAGEEGEEEEAGPRDTVVVLDADASPMAEQVVLQLILKRAKVRAIVKDTAAAQQAFGPYVEAVAAGDGAALRRALRGAKAAVAAGRLDGLLPAAAAARLPRLVLLSAAGAPRRGGLMLFSAADAEAAVLSDASREAEVVASGLRHVIVRVGALADSPGGASALRLAAGGGAPGALGPIAREDAARVAAEAAEWGGGGGGSLVLEAAAAGPGRPPEDWGEAFQALASVPAP